MSDGVRPASGLPRRDRLVVVVGLAGVTLIAWIYLLLSAAAMTDMPAMNGGEMGFVSEVAGVRAWTAVDFALMFLMWAIMMVGMMLPTAAPMTLIYAAVARKAARESSPLAPTAVFVAGYVTMWTLFSVGATAAQWALDQAALLSPMMVATSSRLGAALLIAAGVWQLTPVKHACLEHCRSPAMYLGQHWRDGIAGAFWMGLEHGAYCLGCCWVLMGLLFVGGVMNLLWIAAIAVFVLLEKVLPVGVGGGRAAGVAMIVAGLALLVGFSL